MCVDDECVDVGGGGVRFHGDCHRKGGSSAFSDPRYNNSTFWVSFCIFVENWEE